MKNSILVVALALGVVGCGPRSIYINDEYAKLFDYGRYEVAIAGTTPCPNVSGRVKIEADAVEHAETTLKIPCRTGVSFGLSVLLLKASAREYRLRTEMHHPPIRQPDGQVLRSSVSERIGSSDLLPALLMFAWIFAPGYEYELVPGTWRRMVYLDGILIADAAFSVRK